MENNIEIQRSFLNLLMPTFFKNLWRTIVVPLVVCMLALIAKFSSLVEQSYMMISMEIIAIWLVFSIALLLDEIFMLTFTKYRFLTTGIEKEFKFIVVRKEIIPYEKITNVIINVTIWDRLCGASDIIIKTADDSKPDLMLQYVKNPEEIEKFIQEALRKANSHP